MKFYLGTHLYSWLYKVNYPLFISTRTLSRIKKLKPAITSWALDSGGFTELNKYGYWNTTINQYCEDIKRYHETVGNLEWAAIQDWMCEPFVLEKTKKTVIDHQKLTIENYLSMMERDLPVPIIPIIQGWIEDDYFRHIDMYNSAGINLANCATVGIGSVCRRQHTKEVEKLIKRISGNGIKLHGFGFKIKGLLNVKDYLKSSDSMAWSFAARYGQKLEGCVGHNKCQNCIKFATLWRDRLKSTLGNIDE